MLGNKTPNTFGKTKGSWMRKRASRPVTVERDNSEDEEQDEVVKANEKNPIVEALAEKLEDSS